MALRYTGNTYDAEDLVQETLHIALKRLSQLRDETKCKSWLFKILRSVFLRELTINGNVAFITLFIFAIISYI